MAGTRKGKVFRVVLEPPAQLALLPPPDQYIVTALAPGRNTVRYGREWIVGQTALTRNILSGRIGFRGHEGMAEVWDESAMDFREVAVPAGLTSPFAVNLLTLRMVLQPRGSAIKINGLIGAFKKLLEADGDAWRISTPNREMTFAAWRESVDKVVAARFRLRKPNPHWQATPDLEAVMTQAEAELAVLEMESDAGIETASPFIQQSQRHVERGYGESRFIGIRGQATSEVRESVYNSVLASEEEAVELPTGDDGEVPIDTMIEMLLVDRPEGQAADDHDESGAPEDA